MEEERRRAESAQRESEAKFRRLAENAKDVIFRIRMKPSPAIDYISPAVFRTTGYTADELTRDPGLAMSLLSPEDLPVLAKLTAGKIEFGKPEVLRWKNKDGCPVWMEQVHIPVFNGGGELEAIEGIARDITERMEAEKKIRESLKEKEILLKEVHHRVKNNLQVISSLLRLQANTTRDPKALDMFMETQSRIRSMALIHEKLYQTGEFEKILFSDYIRVLSEDLFKLYGATGRSIRLRLDMEDVSMNLSLAMPCGLIVNELLSNALKHGYPADRPKKGCVRIGLSRMSGRRLHLLVRDDGVGLPAAVDIRNVSTLGLHLVRILAEDQLGGKVRIVRKNGTAFHIVFKY
jgi:PAS domain S-box-containing protein